MVQHVVTMDVDGCPPFEDAARFPLPTTGSWLAKVKPLTDIAIGRDMPLATPTSAIATIYVSKITEGGAAQKQGRIQIGDQIISINGVDVRNARHDEAISLLTGSQSIDVELLRYTTTNTTTDENANGFMTSPSIPSIKRLDDFKSTTKSGDLVNSDSSYISGKPDSRVYLYSEKGIPVEKITLRNDGGPLGLAICGGSDISCLPFGSKEPGIFISKVIIVIMIVNCEN
ncbi:unnamed protein product [Trichobilharzia regenti]|nr:unnamed protein product [Trichobilharzia regenti]